MKRDIKLLNKSLALAITAAMTITSVSPSVVMAENEFASVEEFGDGFEAADVVEAPAAEEAVAETTEEEAGFGDEAATEETFADEVVTDEAVVAEAESVSVGTPGAPAKVTGLWIDTDGKYVSEPTLRWNYVPGVSRYEFSITDAQGNEYGYYPDSEYDETAQKYVYKFRYVTSYDGSNLPSESVEYLSGRYSYKFTDNSWEYVYADAEKTKLLKSLTAGQTYTIKVRAVNTYQASAAEKAVDTAGEWSDAVTYTVPADQVPVAITNLRYVTQDEDYLYFDYDGDVKAGEIEYQVATDDKFENDWWYSTPIKYSNYKLCLYKGSYTSGTTYYLRVANSVNGETVLDNDKNTVWSNTISFQVTKQEEPLKAITGFALYNTTRTAFEFHFDPVLEDEDSWEVQYSKDPNFVTDVKTSGLTISKSSLEPGVSYYVRALTYKYNDKGEKEYGKPSEVVTISRAKLPSISGLTLAERTQNEFVFKYTGVLNNSCGIEYWVSEDANFANNPEITDAYTTTDENSFSIGFYNLTPGKTYYVRARAYSYEDALEDDNKIESRYYSDFTNTVTVKPSVPKVDVSAVAASTSITLRMQPAQDGYVTGYQIQKKSGSKYKALTKLTEGAYTDKKLKADTTYNYRVRAYYVDEKTNKTTWGAWAYYEATTWGGNLNLVATPKSATSVKLVWNKISGAKGYEVYRKVTSSSVSTYSAAAGNNAYDKWVLVKDIKKASTKSYTVSKLTSGRAYDFKVRAYKTVGSKKYYIEDTDSASLAFEGGVELISTKRNSNGTVKASWKPVYTGNGYVIEKYNNKTDEYEVFKTITKASTASYTFPAASGESVSYRIRAYKSGEPKEYASAAEYVTVYPYLAAPTGVTAKANNADGSITVSWKAVAGADYYEVYRTTTPSYAQNKDTNTYSYSGGSSVPVLVADATSIIGYKYSEDKLTATTIVDRPVKYTNASGIEKTFVKGPSAGVKYYYYVVACKYGTGYEREDDRGVIRSGASKAASATVTKASVAAPKSISAKATKGKVTISWKKSANATGYEVYRSTKKSSGYTKIATTNSKTLKYADKKATKGKKYYYKVRAISTNEVGIDIYSGYTSVKSATAK